MIVTCRTCGYQLQVRHLIEDICEKMKLGEGISYDKNFCENAPLIQIKEKRKVFSSYRWVIVGGLRRLIQLSETCKLTRPFTVTFDIPDDLECVLIKVDVLDKDDDVLEIYDIESMLNYSTFCRSHLLQPIGHITSLYSVGCDDPSIGCDDYDGGYNAKIELEIETVDYDQICSEPISCKS